MSPSTIEGKRAFKPNTGGCWRNNKGKQGYVPLNYRYYTFPLPYSLFLLTSVHCRNSRQNCSATPSIHKPAQNSRSIHHRVEIKGQKTIRRLSVTKYVKGNEEKRKWRESFEFHLKSLCRTKNKSRDRSKCPSDRPLAPCKVQQNQGVQTKNPREVIGGKRERW